MVLKASYRDSGRDAYPDILAKAPAFFEKEPGYSDLWAWMRKTGQKRRTEGAVQRFAQEVGQSAKPWADRGLFRVILERFHLLPITWDSHFGEYIGWAHDVSDHAGIKDFYDMYRNMLATAEPADRAQAAGAHRADDRGDRRPTRAARGGGQRPQRRARPLAA